MNQIRRTVLYVAIATIGFLLWSAWVKDHAPVVESQGLQQTTTANGASNGALLAAAKMGGTTVTTPAATQPNSAHIIQVTTDVLNVKIDTLGGKIVSLSLPKYPQTVATPNVPVQLLDTTQNQYYIAESGLISNNAKEVAETQRQYTATQTHYVLQNNEKQLVVKLEWKNDQGLAITKTFTFNSDDYAIRVNYTINNKTTSAWGGHLFGQIKQQPIIQSAGITGLHTFAGVSISTPDKPYEKISYADLDKAQLNRSAQGGWIAVQQRYFLSVWAPNQQVINHYYGEASGNNTYTVGFLGPQINAAPNSEVSTGATFYAGPEVADRLAAVAPHLDLTIDYGWLWIISVAIFWVMKHIHHYVGNWGWSIVLVTLLIKLLFYKLSETSFRSMARMRDLQPKMTALKTLHGDDKQKFSQATMKLYREEKVNPLGGCLPIIIQIPVFFALYYVLIESVELRQAPFILWIHDLSMKDPYFILPVLMGISMFIQQKLSPPPPDPTQAKVMMFLPVIFTVFFLNFPAGLVLYWLTNNVLTILQQWYIIRKHEWEKQHKKKHKKK